MILETEFYFTRSKQTIPKNYNKPDNDAKFIKVKILSLLKKIIISEVMIKVWSKEKTIEIIVNPKMSKLISDGETVNIKPIMPGSSSEDNRKKGGRIGISPEIPVKIPNGDNDQEDEFSIQDMVNGLYSINGYGRRGNVKLPGDEASQEPHEEGFGETVYNLLESAINGAFWGAQNYNELKGELGPGANVIPIVAGKEDFIMVGLSAWAGMLVGVGEEIQRERAIQKFIEDSRDALKTPKADDIGDGRKTTVILGMKPTGIPINPAIDDILEGKDEPLFVFRLRDQAVDPKADANLPEFGGDMIVIFNTSQGVTDPQYDKTKVIGSFLIK